MARGQIQIRRIENSTNRQVTYSKRRKGLVKKAKELTVLCDAKVALIMATPNSTRVYDYVSNSTTMKQMIDQYQKDRNVDVWSSEYEKMQQQLNLHKKKNANLRRQIRQRMGQDLEEMSFEDLITFEKELQDSVNVIHEKMDKELEKQITNTNKRNRSGETIKRELLQRLEARIEDPHYGMVDNGGGYDAYYEFDNGGHRMFALRLQPCHSNLHSGAGSELTTYHLLD